MVAKALLVVRLARRVLRCRVLAPLVVEVELELEVELEVEW